MPDVKSTCIKDIIPVEYPLSIKQQINEVKSES